jgi:hypothetical protein
MAKKNYKLLGEILKPLDLDSPFRDQQQHIENLLCRYLNTRTVVAFIGAGGSIPLGYPSWGDLGNDILLILERIFSGSRTDRRQKIQRKDPNLTSAEVTELLDKIEKIEEAKRRETKVLSYNVFANYSEYIQPGKITEMSAQVIFRECERHLSVGNEWEEKSQSKFFREVIKKYFEARSKRSGNMKRKILMLPCLSCLSGGL